MRVSTVTNTSPSMLAELMLPDGAHTRDQDWTIFFLHKDAELVDEEMEPGTQTPLVYVLNLVITKHDKEAKRWARQVAGPFVVTNRCP